MLSKLILQVVFLICFFHGIGLNAFAQKPEYAEKIISTLASKNYFGRGYLKNADYKAAKFIKKEMKKSGLSPVGPDYFQYFNLNVNTFPGNIKVKLNNHLLVAGKDYLIDPASSSVKGRFKLIIVKRKDLLDRKSLEKIISSISGKALLIDMNDTLKLDKESTNNLNSIINAFKYDLKLGNALTILFSNNKLTWGTSIVRSEKPCLIFNSNNVNLSEFNEISVSINSEIKTNYQTQNVIAKIPGTSQSDSSIVVVAHYDHLGLMGRKTFFPGANDNASGVAMLLEICKHFSSSPLKYNMIFIAFSGEEAGLLGSQFFVQNPPFELTKIRFLINFDLAGTGEEGIKVVNGTIFKNEFETLVQINNQYHFLPSVQTRGEACISDHCPFYYKEVPCFYIYTLGGIKAYHDIFDKAETLPLTNFENYFRLMISFLSVL